MKISALKLKVKDKQNNLIVELEKTELDVSLTEFLELIKSFDSETKIIPPPDFKEDKFKLTFSYISISSSIVNKVKNIIKIGDEVSILPSENCVTNSDKIKYNEIISGEECNVLSINFTSNEIMVESISKKVAFLVHPHWLKLEFRNNDK